MKINQPGNILVVDDDPDVLYTARLILKGQFGKVDILSRPSLIPTCLADCKYDLVLLDMNFTRGTTSGKEGLEWLVKILEKNPDVRVIVTTAYGEINLAVQAMKLGAADFITKPWNKDQLLSSVSNINNREKIKKAENHKNNSPASENSENNKYPKIISKSAVMKQVLETIKTVAATEANVLIMGENGTGKELAAWLLHSESLRKNNAFVHVDLGSIPETLFESELFGHTRGAFTDAKEDRVGRFQAASGGTLFLDEIGNLSLTMQSKILTAVQHREIIKIGTNQTVKVNVRLISATNMPLYQMAESFEFRQDLLYRINTVEVVLPPLRERKEDISLLAEHFIRQYSEFYGKIGINLDTDAREKLEKYHWPGNIRELAHTIERAVILNKTGILEPNDFILKSKQQQAAVFNESVVRVEDWERKAIESSLMKNNGNLSKAANDLGVARTTLYRKISQFGLGSPKFGIRDI